MSSNGHAHYNGTNGFTPNGRINGSNGTNRRNGHSISNGHWPEDVGIVNMSIYFPNQYVDQADLEAFVGVDAGKYTIGLGQTKMGFCSDNEDVNSLCLTVVERLVRKSGISYSDIGRLEVGTETIVDKSKSAKSVVMKLFESSGNHDVEGVDSTNACYGGTAALFNCVSWVESRDWDGRYAVAVCADIAVYEEGPARPTGGAGAVAMLIGPNAALVLEPGLRATHSQHVYDFYKPDMASEYPTVDARLSIKSYLTALDKCYALHCEKATAKAAKKGSSSSASFKKTTLNSFDAVLFHTPFCKLVQKSMARLALNDFLGTPREERMSSDRLSAFSDVSLEESYFDKSVEKAFMESSSAVFEGKTKPSLMLATNVGNMYTPSLYGGLISYLCSEPLERLPGRRLGLFSYGSGFVSSFYSIVVSGDSSPDSPLASLKRSIADVPARMDARRKVDPADYDRVMKLRESVLHREPGHTYTPVSSTDNLFPGTWYLADIDAKHRRSYEKAGSGDEKTNGLTTKQNGFAKAAAAAASQ